MNERHQAIELTPGSGCARTPAEGELDAVTVFSGAIEHPASEVSRLRRDEVAVHQREGLDSRGGGDAARAIDFHGRCVEGIEQALRDGPPHKLIDAAPSGTELILRYDFARRLRSGTHRLAKHFRIVLPGHREHGVTHAFGFETPRRHAPHQLVLGVRLQAVGTRRGGLAIGRGHHDELVQLLDAPTLAHEFGGEPIEERGV